MPKSNQSFATRLPRVEDYFKADYGQEGKQNGRHCWSRLFPVHHPQVASGQQLGIVNYLLEAPSTQTSAAHALGSTRMM